MRCCGAGLASGRRRAFEQQERELTIRRWRIWLPLIAVLVIAALIAWFVAGSRGGSPRVASLPALQPLHVVQGPAGEPVQQAGGGSVLVQTASGTQRRSLPANLKVDVLQPAPVTQLQVGDWLSIGGVANQINAAAIKQIVDIPAALVAPGTTAAAPPRSRDGFTGFEGETDARIGPVLYGRVQAVNNSTVTLDAAVGVITLTLTPQSQPPILRLQSGSPDQIHDGDRLAFAGGAVLVRPGGS